MNKKTRQVIKKVLREVKNQERIHLGVSNEDYVLGFPKYLIGDICITDIVRGTGVSLSMVSRIFNGHRQPSLNCALKMTKYIRRKLRRRFSVEDLMQLIADRNRPRQIASDQDQDLQDSDAGERNHEIEGEGSSRSSIAESQEQDQASA